MKTSKRWTARNERVAELERALEFNLQGNRELLARISSLENHLTKATP